MELGALSTSGYQDVFGLTLDEAKELLNQMLRYEYQSPTIGGTEIIWELPNHNAALAEGNYGLPQYYKADSHVMFCGGTKLGKYNFTYITFTGEEADELRKCGIRQED